MWNIDDLLTYLKTDVEAKERLISHSNYDKSFDGNEDNKSKNSNGRPFTSPSLFNSSDNHNPHDSTKRDVHYIVFDAASKTKSDLTLNDSLLTGPCLLPLLKDILVRFRISKYDLVTGIKQAFLQICLEKEHSDFVRFLWFTDINDISSEVVI